MSTLRLLQENDIPSFLAFLAKEGNRILVPVEKQATKTSIVFEQWEENKPFTLVKATVPPKDAVLPHCETLFTYKKSKQGDNKSIELTETNNPQNTVIFACRPCDARGFTVLDRPYMQGPFVDPYYKNKREKLTVISFTCPSGASTCFCHWIGSGPTSSEGSDILVTRTEKGLVLESVTDKGEEILKKSKLDDAKDLANTVKDLHKKAIDSLEKAPDLTKSQQNLAKIFANEEFWEKETDRCLSCGACTYFCPTCYCFTITDEGEPESEKGGKRLRSWDSCMSSMFTREASGHNPRKKKGLRMRNRVSHKFSTYPENWGTFSCNGCGRCITNCPVHLDIREIVLDGIKQANEK